MTSIQTALAQLRETIPAHVRLVAVSKTHPVSMIREAMEAGQFDFGENKMQEMTSKYLELGDPRIVWHCIGHLQRNKVKMIAPYVHLIHSVDSLGLLEEIDRQAARCGRTLPCLLQIHIAQEETKFGFSEEEVYACLESSEFKALEHIRICGLMGIASTTGDTAVVRKEFRRLALLHAALKKHCFPQADDFRELSMGMSGDYRIAIDEGSTIVRVGSLIFGERNYAI